MDNELKSSLTAADTWLRGLYMLLFTVVYSVTELVLGLVVVFQFIHVLVTRETNDRLLDFSSDLSVFIYQILQFLTFNSEAKPYPFSAWPDGPADLESLDLLDNVAVSAEPENTAVTPAEDKGPAAGKDETVGKDETTGEDKPKV
jgi:hypothetical protein